MTSTPRPHTVVWEMTYACPLRCGHCHTNAGRRPSRGPAPSDLHRLVDAIAPFAPAQVLVSGGEPLIVPGIWDVLKRLKDAGFHVSMFTSGWDVDDEAACRLAEQINSVHVSVDGPDSRVNDAVRGRTGAFDRAMNALLALDRACSKHKAFSFGVAYTVVRSNLASIERFCSEVVSQLQKVRFLHFGAAIPSGAGKSERYVESEILTERELEDLRGPALADRLRELLRPDVKLSVSDQIDVLKVAGPQELALYLEPDGELRALPAVLGSVGNVLDESPALLWERVLARRRDPELVRELSRPRTLQEWGPVVRRLEASFGAADELAQIRPS